MKRVVASIAFGVFTVLFVLGVVGWFVPSLSFVGASRLDAALFGGLAVVAGRVARPPRGGEKE